jgi:hypothetical protein
MDMAKAKQSDLKITAIHEAGHAVAHKRLHGGRFDLKETTIQRDDDSLGHCSHEEILQELGLGETDAKGKYHFSHEVTKLLSGYAANVVAGVNPKRARRGCDSDFEKAEKIIAGWHLPPLPEQIKTALDLMARPENRRAVDLVASELLKNVAVPPSDVECLVEVADGKVTLELYQDGKIIEQQRLADRGSGGG